MNTLYYDPLAYDTLGVEIFIPDPSQVKEAYEEGAISEFPYWSKIWPASLALASWLSENHDLISAKNVFEVGAGLGLPSFVAAKHAASVMISDHVPLAVEWMKFNIKSPGMGSMLFDWRTRPLPEADIVLMSDIGYQEEDFSDVHEMIRQYVSMGSAVLLSVPARRISGKFIEPLDPYVKSREILTALDTEILLLIFGTTDFPLPVQRMNS